MFTLKLNFYLSLLVILLNSCATTHGGAISGNACISNPNFSVRKTAIGAAKTTKILGFGGDSPNGMVYSAKTDLLKYNPLEAGQTLANLSVDFKTTQYLFWSTTMVILHADIVDFNTDSLEDAKPMNFQVLTYKGYNLNDEVALVKNYKKEYYTIVKLEPQKVTLKAKDGTIIQKKYTQLPSRDF